ncbi:MAG: transcriptional regulator [Ilumatobacteraceae bacterium]
MTHESDPTFHALHAVRLRGRATIEAITHSLGAAASEVEILLKRAAAAGHLKYREGRAAGWSLTPEGRDAHAALVAADREGCGAADTIREAYQQFLGINQDLIGVCTNWQVKPDGSMNDHADASYDADVIEALATIDGRAQPVCAQLAMTMLRFGGYGSRLGEALANVRAGETQWFTSPACDSYHTVWFELHEDLLQTLGIERANEHAT